VNIPIYLEYLQSLNFRDDDIVCVSFGKGGGIWVGDFFQPFGALRSETTIEKLSKRNKDGQNIFMSMAPFQAGTKNRKKEFVAGVRHVFADVDFNGKEILERINADVAAGVMPDPAVGIESSPGKVQVIWHVNGDFDIARQEAVNRAIQARYDTDPSTVDTARLLRIPGFMNHKYEDKPLAGILARGTLKAHPFADFKIESPLAKTAEAKKERVLFGDGFRHTALLNQMSLLVRSGVPREIMADTLIAWFYENCETGNCKENPEEHIRKMVGSADWKTGNPAAELVWHGDAPAGTSPDVLPRTNAEATKWDEAKKAEQNAETERITANLGLVKIPHPKFPEWAIRGTSTYEGLCKPLADINQRYVQYMWMPAAVIALNILGGKVSVSMKDWMPTFYLACIGKAGEVIKSSCVQDAHRYFSYMGLAGHGQQSDSNANGRSLMFTIGSVEGFGKEMNRLNCTNGVLLYDELDGLVGKSNIESSSMSSGLLTAYESGKLQNVVKNPRDAYSLMPGTYTASLIVCSTDEAFEGDWSKLAGKKSGLTDRFFFLYQPETLKPKTPYTHVSTQLASVRTRALIEKAFNQKVYEIEKDANDLLIEAAKTMSNRSEIRAEKLALWLAIDLDRDVIDGDAVERALAIIDYEIQVKNFLRMADAETKEGAIQTKVLSILEREGGVMSARDLYLKIKPRKYGTTLWGQCYKGLVTNGYIREVGSGKSGDPKMVHLLRYEKEGV
jgi:hypothetical protein